MANANPNQPNPASTRAYAAAHFALELDGKDDVGLFRSVEGGGVKADVMTYQYGASNADGYLKFRQLGKPKFDDIKLQVGMAMSWPFYGWLSNFIAGKATRKSGAILAADFYYNERARRNFSEAMIKEMTFPKLDASDKNAVYMGITMCVEDITFLKGTGKQLTVPKGTADQKLWTACNFEMTLDGAFKDACRRVTKIDSFTIKQNVAEYHQGGLKAAVKTPTAMEFPNISFYLPEADAQVFLESMSTQVGFGNNGDKKYGMGKDQSARFGGSITTFDSEHGTLLTLELTECDIVSVTPDRSDASSEEVKQVKVELYTTKMKLTYPGMDLL